MPPVTDYLRRLFRRRTVRGPTLAATFEPLTALKPMTLVVGRIYKIDAATEIWRWDISLPLNSCEIYGDAPTREDATAAFRAEYERWIEERSRKPDWCKPSRPNWQERSAPSMQGLDQRLQYCEGHQLDNDSAVLVPANLIGRTLTPKEASKLIQKIDGALRKRPARSFAGKEKLSGPEIVSPKETRRDRVKKRAKGS